MRKLNLHSVADITLYAVRHGIVQIFETLFRPCHPEAMSSRRKC
jgi:hypothetical protein